MDMRMPETCLAVFKWQVINLRSCCILLVNSVESMMTHGLENPKFKKTIFSGISYFPNTKMWWNVTSILTYAVKSNKCVKTGCCSCNDTWEAKRKESLARVPVLDVGIIKPTTNDKRHNLRIFCFWLVDSVESYGFNSFYVYLKRG